KRILVALQALGLVPRTYRFDQLPELAVDHAIELVQGEPDAMIGDAVLWEVVGADLFRAFAAPDHAAALVANFGGLALALEMEEPALQHLERSSLVFDLAALVLAFDDQARRDMRDLNRGVGGVDPLPARSPRRGDVDFQILVVDFDLDVFGFGHHGHGRGR